MRLSWQFADAIGITCIHWPEYLNSGKSIDPYLVWADLTQFGGLGGWNPGKGAGSHGSDWPFLIELTDVEGGHTVPKGNGNECPKETQCDSVFGMLRIPGAYKSTTDHDSIAWLQSSFVTALVSPACLADLLKWDTPIVRMQLGLPRIPQVDTAARDRSMLADAETRVVLGIIDDGYAFAHPNLQDLAGQCKVVYLWDQDPDRAADQFPLPLSNQDRWKPVKDFPYGAQLSGRSIKLAMDVAARQERAPVTYPYELLDYLPHRPSPDVHSSSIKAAGSAPAGTMLPTAHGTSVLHLAGGSAAPDLRAPRHTSLIETPVPQVPASPIILVQLPTRTTLDTSGGSLGVHVLDGIRYVIDQARSLPKVSTDPPVKAGTTGIDVKALDSQSSDAQNPAHIVINISYGAIAGPHDGTSILEKAMAKMVEDESSKENKIWIVVAAGNAHDSRTHARTLVSEGTAGKSLLWTLGPDNVLDSYLEVWLPEFDDDGHAISPSDFMVSVYPPGDLPPQSARAGDAWLMKPADTSITYPLGAVVFSRRVAQGEHGTMVLIAVGPTAVDKRARDRVPRPAAPHGEWRINVAFKPERRSAVAGSAAAAVVHAWAERNDLLWGNIRPQQSTVVVRADIPKLTEFSPSVRKYCESMSPGPGPIAFTDEVPRPFMADISFSSIACGDPAPENAWDDPTKANPSVVVVGGYRLSDGEIAPYSAGGPSMGSTADRGRRVGLACDAAPSQDGSRIAPDIDAPSDRGLSTRGLLTHGTVQGTTAVLGGTSAAAPLVSRFLVARLAKLSSTPGTPEPHGQAPGAGTVVRRSDLGFDDLDRASRPTGTPTIDDRFRAGRTRLKP